MEVHVHDFKSVPVSVRKPHALGIFLLWLVLFFPAAFLYLLIPRGQQTQFQSRCRDCGAEEPKAKPVPFDWARKPGGVAGQGNPCYRGKRVAQ